MTTNGKYQQETERILMGDEDFPTYGYKPIDIRNRIIELLKREKRAKDICDKKLYKGIAACPYCGWTHE